MQRLRKEINDVDQDSIVFPYLQKVIKQMSALYADFSGTNDIDIVNYYIDHFDQLSSNEQLDFRNYLNLSLQSLSQSVEEKALDREDDEKEFFNCLPSESIQMPLFHSEKSVLENLASCSLINATQSVLNAALEEINQKNSQQQTSRENSDSSKCCFIL